MTVNPESTSPDDVRSALESTIANKDAITHALGKLTKEQLKPYSGWYVPSDVKKGRLVDNAWDSLVNDFRWLVNKGPTMVTTGGRSIEQHARDAVAGITQSVINEYSASVKQAQAKRQQRADAVRSAIDNPQTLDDYRTLIKAKGRAALTTEQGEKYDQLLAEHQIEQQKTQKETPRVTEGFTHGDTLQINPVEEGKNSKTGETVYNVNLQTRLGTEKFKEAAGMARKLGGGYWRGNFWFPSSEKAQQFVGWLRGDSVDHSTADAERRVQKQEQQQERLTSTSDRLRESAEDRLNADRKVNTVKRLREAASAMDQANRDLRDADIMQKIAQGIADGSLKYLSGIQHKTQIDTLRGIARRLVYDIPQDIRDSLSYTTSDGKREWNDDVPLTSRVKYARYPMLDWHPSTLFDVIGKMGDARGYKLAASELRLSQQREHGMSRLPAGRKANDKLAAYLSGQPGSWHEYVAEYNRLQRAGITTRPLLRAALVELEKLSGDVPLNDIPKIQKMEMDLRKKLAWDRNAFNDFFPTPESRADWIANEADIQPGMDVLEPSAGNGVLAEAARKAGGNVDVVELEQQLRDILKEKGFNVVDSDFDEFTPDKLYDRVLMNPPFSHDLDIKHVQKAFEHLKPGGKLVAIVSTMAGERSNKRNQAFREWLNELGAREEKLPEGMFKESMNPTNVATKLLTLTKPDEINYSKVPRSVWDKDFPDTVLHGRLGDATAHKDYVAAKGGDDAAARRLVADVMTRESVNELRQLLAGRKAILAAVHAEEAVSRNAIPQAMADVLSKVLDLDVATGVVQAAKVGRTAQDGFGRLTNQPAFEGPVRTDLPYILLDDTLTQGGTLANLKGYIEDHGGKVIGASALTGKKYSAKIALAADTLRKLRDHFEGTDLENWWNEQHGYGFDRLTESEANYLLRAADADKIRDRVLAARSDGTPSAEPESLRDNGPVPPDVNHKFSQNASESGGVFASGSPRERIRSGVADYQPRGLNKKQVEDEVARFLKKWKGAGGIAVQVAKDVAEAEQLAGFPLPDALIHAMHLPNSGRIILVAKNLDSLSHVRAKLRHEILGHHALSEVVGPAEYDKLLRTVAAGQSSKSLKAYFDRVAENYEGADPWKQVEEVISHVIEDGERGFLGRAWDRVSGAVLQALRKSGFLSDENITAGEVRSMMAPIARRLKKLGGWAENTDKKKDITASFSLTGKDGLFSKPLPGETETEATQRRSKNFGHVVQETIGNVRNLRPTDIIKRLRSNISTNALMIGTLTNRQLAAVYNKLMKTDYAGQYQDLQAKMEARRNRIMNSAERGIENQWNKLDKEESRTLSDLMVDATMARVHPDKPLAEQDRFQNLKNEQTRLRSSKSGDNKEESASRLVRVSADLDAMRDNYNDLHSRWMTLSPEAKELWHDTEKWYKNSYADLKEALIQRINDVGGDQNTALISRVREQFERALKDGPYFPLARFGKYVVTARKDGDYIREHFETRSAALAALEAYRKEGYQAAQSVKAKENGKNDDSAHSLGKEILDLLNKSEDGNLNKEQLTDQVWQMMLELMPDSSYARHFIRRRRVKGASHDARRAFANSAFHFAHHISKIEYGHKMQAVLDDMGNEIDAAMKGDYSGVQPDNLETAQRMLDELKMRHEMTMNPSGDGFGNALTGTGYVFNMAANPSSAIINMTQTALVALPQLAARYGWKNAMKAMGTATVDYFRSADKRFKWFGKGSSWLDRDAWLSMSRSNRLGADELELMKRLNEDGVISITQASSLAQRAETGTKDKIHFNKALDMSILIGGQLFHNVEVANREVTALAAYRLAKTAADGRIDPAQAYKVASNAVYDAHFDYSSANRPRWMRQSWQKVVLQFKMYAQHMFYTLGRSFTQSFKGETPEIRREAQKEFLGYMLMHTLAAGVTGLPYVVQVIFGAASQGIHAAVSDDDTSWDPEVALKNWLTDELGGFASTAITDGVVNALGIDLHSRVGIQDLLWRSPPIGTEGKDLYVYDMEQMLGPTIGGIGLNFASGYDKMAKGDWLGGIQTVTPAAVKNLVKTYAEATRGVTTSSGEEIVPADEFTHFELAAQAFGFSPSRIGLAYDARSAVKNVQSELSNRRAQLLQRYFANAMRGDDNGEVLEDIQAYNRSNSTNAITGEIILKAMRQKQKARLKKERGLALSRKDEHLRTLGRFGSYDPVM
ncbi:TPA: PLxRFG domain-containing protein [Citrobacter freundii]|nr:PLxRFG domain-containing protein [Citrobacter freundii]